MKLRVTVTAALALAGSATIALAQEIKIGLMLPFTGVGAEFGQQGKRGIEQFLKLNADKVKPYTFKIIERDEKDASGANAKIVIQELITQDKVDFLLGWIYSPNAIATAPIVAAGKVPAIITNAGTAHITNLTTSYARVSFSMWHAGHSLGTAAAKQLNAKTAVVGFTDYPPGKDSLNAFKTSFEKEGGKVIDEIPMGGPNAVPDFTPFFQRAKEKKPDVFFVFVPSGDHSTAVARTYGALGMKEAGIKLIGPGDITQDNKLQAMGNAAAGLVTMHHYNADLDNPENKRFVESWKKDYGADSVPDFIAVANYDGMAAIVHAVTAQKGKVTHDGTMAALKTFKSASPRGTVAIDPETRDVVMNEYLSEVTVSGGRLTQKQIGKIDSVKDPCKALKVGPCANIPQ
jgi:branched-chain amino acid transport system substrate-binding protein